MRPKFPKRSKLVMPSTWENYEDTNILSAVVYYT